MAMSYMIPIGNQAAPLCMYAFCLSLWGSMNSDGLFSPRFVGQLSWGLPRDMNK